jgi:membrane-bound metal-dependent hydrolase YbcI (DUF457 family)
MPYISQLFTEAFVVGVVLAAALALVAYYYPIDSSYRGLAIGYFLGVAIHLGFEYFGANAWYCAHGAACMA